MNKSVFLIRKMDCASEESMVRMKLDEVSGIEGLAFDIPSRRLTVIHESSLDEIKNSIDSLDFSASLESTEKINDSAENAVESTRIQASLLWKVLIINFTFFLIEIITGLVAGSMGLVADSLDMLADALVYGLSLFAVGSSVVKKKQIAGISGYFQLALAAIGLAEVLRRFFGFEQVPDFRMMMIISFFALIANSLCLYLLQKSRSREAHMKASIVFTSNDVIINLGVIAAGILVFAFDSRIPDLLVGGIVFVIVTRGALSILRLSK